MGREDFLLPGYCEGTAGEYLPGGRREGLSFGRLYFDKVLCMMVTVDYYCLSAIGRTVLPTVRYGILFWNML